jgi:hypothetical protein
MVCTQNNFCKDKIRCLCLTVLTSPADDSDLHHQEQLQLIFTIVGDFLNYLSKILQHDR